jgi:hypothetical protein
LFIDRSNLHLKFFNGDTLLTSSLTSILNSFRSDWEGGVEVVNSLVNNNGLFFTLMRDGEFGMPDYVNLRQTTKDLIVTSNAIIKVFKSRYDDYRALARLSDFTALEATQPLISGERVKFETFINKIESPLTSVDFVTSNFALNSIVKGSIIKLQNVPLFDFPFLVAAKSEAARHI